MQGATVRTWQGGLGLCRLRVWDEKLIMHGGMGIYHYQCAVYCKRNFTRIGM